MFLNEDFFDDNENSEIVSTDDTPDYENTIEEKYTHNISITYSFNLVWLNNYRLEYLVRFVKKLNYVINNLSFVKNSKPHIFGYKHLERSETRYPFDFDDKLTMRDAASLIKMDGTNVVLTIDNLININKVSFKKFCSDIHKLYTVSTYKNGFPKQYLVAFADLRESDGHIHGFSPSNTMWMQEAVKEIYKFLYKEDEVYNLYDDEKYKKLFRNQTQKIPYLYYLHQIDNRVQVFKDFIVDIYAVNWLPINGTRKLDVYMTVVCMNDNMNKTGDIVDFVYKKFAKALQSTDKEEFIDVDRNDGTVNFFVYVNPDIQPSKSLYTGKTIDVSSGNKVVTFEDFTSTSKSRRVKYTYNIVFVDKDWNMTEDRLDDLYRQHNKWKNMKF